MVNYRDGVVGCGAVGSAGIIVTTVSAIVGMLAIVGGVGSVLAASSRQPLPERWFDAILIIGVGALLAGVAVLVGPYHWWIIIPLTLFVLMLVLRWEMRRGALGKRIWLLPGLVMGVGWLLSRRPQRVDLIPPGPGDGLTLTDIQAEYAQSVLDDAEYDPNLAELLEHIGSGLLTVVRTLEAEMFVSTKPAARPLIRYMLLTGLANHYLATITEPGATIGPRPYRGYSFPMLTLAAVCHLATSDKLRTR